MDIPLEKKFSALCQIERASHFAWREAVRELCPGVDIARVVNRMWEITAHGTALSYLKRLRDSKPLPGQIAESIVWSSVTMGEDASVKEGRDEKEAFVRHEGCPWYEWHKRLGLLEEDKEGCQRWFEATIDEINRELGTKVRVELQKSLPDGDDCCLRRIWVD